jgi:hypothetical protein
MDRPLPGCFDSLNFPLEYDVPEPAAAGRKLDVGGEDSMKENEEEDEVVRIRDVSFGERRSLKADGAELEAALELAAPRLSTTTSGMESEAVFREAAEVFATGEAAPITPPRSRAFRTRVARSGLLDVPGERRRLRRLVEFSITVPMSRSIESSKAESRVVSASFMTTTGELPASGVGGTMVGVPGC